MPRSSLPLSFLTFAVLAVTAGALGCAHSTSTVELPVRAVTSVGGNAEAHLAVPKGWSPMMPSESRVEYLAPDRHTRAYFRAMPGEKEPKACAKLAKQYTTEVIDSWGGPPRTRVHSRRAAVDGLSFELRRSEPRPTGEVIWGRVMCRQGALAIVTCTTPLPPAPDMERACTELLESLDITPKPEGFPGASPS